MDTSVNTHRQAAHWCVVHVCVKILATSLGLCAPLIRESFLSFTTFFDPGYLSLFSFAVQFPYISQDIKLTEIKLP